MSATSSFEAAGFSYPGTKPEAGLLLNRRLMREVLSFMQPSAVFWGKIGGFSLK